MNLLDLLLLPKNLYKKLTAKKGTLYLGILLVGLKNITFTVAFDNFKVFSGKDREALIYNLLVFAALAVVLGVLDVVCFSLPLADLFKLFKKERELVDKSGAMVKVMKIYILSHIIIVLVETILLITFLKNITSSGAAFALALLYLLYPFWFCAAITRGVNTIYDFQPLFKWLVFPAVYLWSFILGKVMAYAMDRWIMPFFR